MADRQNLIDDCVSLIKADDKFGLESNRFFYNKMTNSNVKIKDYISDYYENNKVGEALETIQEFHVNKHKEIYENETEWNLWMDNSLPSTIYIVDENGKYEENNTKWSSHGPNCPFCIYRLKEYKETGTYKEVEYWSDLYYFNRDSDCQYRSTFVESANKIWENKNKSSEYKLERRELLITNILKNFSTGKLRNLLKTDWDSEKIQDLIAFREKWNNTTVKISGAIEKITHYDNCYVIKIDNTTCIFETTESADVHISSENEQDLYFSIKASKTYSDRSWARGYELSYLLRDGFADDDNLLNARRIYSRDEINNLNIGDIVTIIGNLDDVSRGHCRLQYCEFVKE